MHEDDPNKAEVKKSLKGLKKNIIQRIKDSDMWEFDHPLWEEGQGTYEEFEDENNHYVVRYNFYPNHLKIYVNVRDLNWHQQKIQEKENFFEIVGDKDEDLEVGNFAEKLEINPQEDFKIEKKWYSPAHVVDRIGMRIDGNIIELIRYIYMLGLDTEQSCGGHENRSSFPYITFKNNENFDKIIALFYAWRQKGGKMTKIEFLGNLIESIRLTYPEEMSLEESQADLDDFTEFLAEKIGRVNVLRRTISEIRNQIRRALKS